MNEGKKRINQNILLISQANPEKKIERPYTYSREAEKKKKSEKEKCTTRNFLTIYTGKAYNIHLPPVPPSTRIIFSNSQIALCCVIYTISSV